jgi:type III secretion protein T
MIVPVFSQKVLTGLARNGFVFVLALFVSPSVDVGALIDIPLPLWIVLIAKEALIGILFGFAFSAMLWAIENVGNLIDFQTGSNNSSFFDPVSGNPSGPTGAFLSFLALVLFVTGGGLREMLGLFFDSYRVWPIGALAPNLGAVLEQFAVREMGDTMSWTVKLATPVILVLLLVEMGIGLISRAVPQLNVFVFSQPIKSALAMLMMALFLYFVYTSLIGFVGPDGMLFGLMRAALKSPS